MRRELVAVALGAVLGISAGCSTPPNAATEAQTNSLAIATTATRLISVGVPTDPLPLRVPIRGVMAGIIDFSAHGVFETATSELPLTDNDWLAAGLASINLIGSATLITSPGTGPDDAEWVSDPEWRRWAQTMQSASISAGAATVRKDRDAFLRAANRLADACQSCHDRFRPEAPLSNSQFAASVRLGLNLQ